MNLEHAAIAVTLALGIYNYYKHYKSDSLEDRIFHLQDEINGLRGKVIVLERYVYKPEKKRKGRK